MQYEIPAAVIWQHGAGCWSLVSPQRVVCVQGARQRAPLASMYGFRVGKHLSVVELRAHGSVTSVQQCLSSISAALSPDATNVRNARPGHVGERVRHWHSRRTMQDYAELCQ